MELRELASLERWPQKFLYPIFRDVLHSQGFNALVDRRALQHFRLLPKASDAFAGLDSFVQTFAGEFLRF